MNILKMFFYIENDQKLTVVFDPSKDTISFFGQAHYVGILLVEPRPLLFNYEKGLEFIEKKKQDNRDNRTIFNSANLLIRSIRKHKGIHVKGKN